MGSNMKRAEATIHLKASSQSLSVGRKVVDGSLKKTFADLYEWAKEGKHDSVFESCSHAESEVFLIPFHAVSLIEIKFKD